MSTPSNLPRHAAEHLLLSRLTGSLPLEQGRTLLFHVLGRTMVVVDEQVLSIVQRFERPTTVDNLIESAGIDVETAHQVVAQLRDALLLRPAEQDEDMWIRQKYTRRLQTIPLPAWGITSPSDVPSRAERLPPRLTLSSALVKLPLDGDDFLVTHPLGHPTHLTERLWRLALSFHAGAELSEVLRNEVASADGAQVMAAVELLVARRILWSSEEDERAAIQRAFPCDPDVSMMLTPIPVNRWRAAYLPYDLGTAGRHCGEGAVALVGYCQLLAVAEPLQHIAARQGWRLDVQAFLTGDALPQADWSLVVLSLTPLAASFYEAAAAGDLAAARALTLEILSRADHAIAQIRARTSAPLAVVGLSAPGLWLASDMQAAQLDSMVAMINQRLSETLARSGRDFLIDERGIPQEVGFRGIYWDDDFNAIPHHSPVSNWTYIDLPADFAEAGMTRSQLEQLEPPREPGQMDPAEGLAVSLWRRFLRARGTTPVRAIVFEPDELLWPGKLADREEPFPGGGPHFYTADHYYFYAGIHEALAALRRRGVFLACRSTCPTEALLARWKLRSPLRNLVRLEDLALVAGGDDPHASLSYVAGALEVPEEQILLVDLVSRTPADFLGRIYDADRWGLRRYLLTAPELHPSENREGGVPLEDVRQGPARNQEQAQNAPPHEMPADELAKTIDEVLCARFRCDSSALTRVDDLRILGLDSMGGLDLMNRVQDRLGILFDDNDFVATTVFSRSGLLQAALRASRRRSGSTFAPNTGVHRGRTFEAWCAAGFGTILREQADDPRVPWIFKIRRSPRRFDHEYISWAQLMERAAGYTKQYAELGVQAGGIVMLLLPLGSALIAAFLGAILGGLVPSICAHPSEKLSRAAFAGWFGTVVQQSGAELIVCDPELESIITTELRAHGLSVPVETQVPAPTQLPSALPAASPDAPLLLQHSSGTTGLKKAVLLSHREVLSQVWELSHALECSSDDRIVSWLPLYHDMGLVACLLLPLLCSIPTVILSPFEWVQQPSLLLQEVSAERGSLCWMPNFGFHHMSRSAGEGGDFDLSSLRAVVNCSEPITASAFDAFYQRFSRNGLRYTALSSSYAMAEATFAVTQTPPGHDALRRRFLKDELYKRGVARPAPADADPEQVCELVSSGRPLPRCRVEIVGADGEELPDGQVGEILIQSDSLMSAYYNDLAATAAAIVGRRFSTGDLGFSMGGELFVTGRMKDLIIVAGHNVYPHEVEEVVSGVEGVYPGRTVAFGVFDETEGTERLVVLAELDERSQKDAVVTLAERIRTLVLGTFGVVVSDIRLLPVRSLIKSTSGKISRSQNRRLYLESRT